MRAFLPLSVVVLAVASAAIAPAGCDDSVRALADEPTYRSEVAAILDAKCARCHANGSPGPAAGFRVDSYPGAIGCTATGKVAVLPGDPSAPLIAVLSTPDHQGFTTNAERATLTRWVASGAQSTRAAVHPRSFADPRSATSHAAQLRATRYRSLTDRNDDNACARCHDGATPRPSDVIAAAPGATACTTCHTDEGGVSACSTCHGAPGRGYPPRDTCFYGGDPKNDAHAAHAAPSAARATPLECSACHPAPVAGQLDGAHTDGYVEVWFDTSVAGRLAQLDPNARRCTGTCHDRGGSNPTPSWGAASPPLDCNSCHTSPPKDQFTGPCSSCHEEANATGTALVAPRLHVNGKVDLGDGSGGCGACHGTGQSPWPTSGAHAAHMAPANAVPVACETCHVVPGPNDAHPLRAGAANVRLVGLATKDAHPASYDPATKTCASTYCHDGPGAQVNAPRWTDGEPARACGACHSTPPPPPHAQLTSCGQASCHQGITDTSGLTVTPAGRTVHVNGLVDRSVP